MSDTKEADVVLKRKSLEGTGPGAGDEIKKPKFSFGLKKSSATTESSSPAVKKVAPVKLKLGQQKPKETEKRVLKPSGAAARAFADESDEEEEDMPPEAKMRMKNMGKNTPTSAGPNSFNKSKMGFCSPSAKWKTPRLKSNAEKTSTPDEEGET